jgi:hypothetical protein
MAAGFNLTVYSRLNLVTQNTTLLRVAFWSVIVVCAIGKIPVVISESIPTVTGKKVYRDALYADIIFTLEGFFLCGLYIYLFRRKFVKDLRPNNRTRSFFRLLIIAQTIVAVVDVAANVLLFLDYYLPASSTTPLRFAIKVKIEFVILNRLVLFTNQESLTLPRYICGSIEHRSEQNPKTTECLHRNLTEMDGIGRSICGIQNSDSLLKQSGHHTLKSSRSLPDLSLYKEVDKRIFESREHSDQWSATDIRYLGRFLTDIA